MFATIPVALLALSLSVFAAPIQQRDVPSIQERGAPADWAWGYLEDYNTYHTRYEALDCEDKHGQSFFDTCCHPLLASQSLSSRPSYCTPSSATSSAPAATPTDSDDGECSDDSDESSAPANPAPAPTPKPAPTTYAPAPAPTTSQASSGGGGGGSGVISGGVATYFYQGGNAGACGDYHSDYDYIVAIDIDRYGDDSQASPLCGKSITIQNTENGKEINAVIADVCPSCDNSNSLDLSVGAFQALASLSEGEFPINYWFD